jgi:acyl-CoA thioester hydrolase
LIVSSSTSYASSLSYPSPVVAALAVSNLSARSVTWRIALFEGEYVPALEGDKAGQDGGMEGFGLEALRDREGGVGRKLRVKRDEKTGEEVRAAAWGDMVHVFVDEQSRRPLKELDEGLRRALERLLVKVDG